MRYAFWPCDEGAGSKITSRGSHSIVLTKTGGDCWANDGWLTLDGSTYFDVAWSSLTPAQQTFLSPGNNSIFAVWCEIELVTGDDFTGAPSMMVPINWGQNGGGDALVQLRVEYPPNLLRARLRDSSAFHDMSGAHDSFSMDSRRVFMLVIDPNRKAAWFYRNRYLSNGNVDFRALGAINPMDGYLRVGSGVDWDGSANLGYHSRLRNVGILNMGVTLPRGIDNTLRDLLANGGNPEGIL